MRTFSYLHSQFSVRVFLAAAALASAGNAAAQVGLGLTPMREELQMAPGGAHSGTLALVNDSPAKVRVVAEPLDFYIDATTTPQFVRQALQEAAYSCRDWLVLNPMEMEMSGNSRVIVRYTLRVPPGAEDQSFHCAVGFTTQPPAEEIKVTGLRTAVQIVSAFYVVVGKPSAEGSVKGIRLEYVPDPKQPRWKAIVVLHNPSLMHFRPVGDLDVLNEAGEVVESVKFISLPVLPKRDQNFELPLKLEGGPGKYTLRARVDLGANEIQEATAVLVAAKPGTPLPLVTAQ
jgi:hypothetical protein